MIDKLFTPIGFLIFAFFFIGLFILGFFILKILSNKGGIVKFNIKEKEGLISIGTVDSSIEKVITKKEIKKNNLNYKISVLIIKFIKIYNNIKEIQIKKIEEQFKYIKMLENKVENLIMSGYEEVLKHIYDTNIVSNTNEYKHFLVITQKNNQYTSEILKKICETVKLIDFEYDNWMEFKKETISQTLKDCMKYVEKNSLDFNSIEKSDFRINYELELSRKLAITMDSSFETLKEIECKYNILINKNLNDIGDLCIINNIENITKVITI